MSALTTSNRQQEAHASSNRQREAHASSNRHSARGPRGSRARPSLSASRSFITFVNFVESDTIATAGEDASWVGVLLSGVLEALSADGNLLNTLGPGRIVGEMALFHGGRRNERVLQLSTRLAGCVRTRTRTVHLRAWACVCVRVL